MKSVFVRVPGHGHPGELDRPPPVRYPARKDTPGCCHAGTSRRGLALLLLTGPACLGVGDAPAPTAQPSARKMLHGDAAMKAVADRAGQVDATVDRTVKGTRVTKYDYPDGATAIVATGPGRKDYTFWEAPAGAP